MKTNILRPLTVLVLMAITLTMTHATVVNWSCDPANGTYCIIDIDGGSSSLAPNGNPYMIYVPQNIVNGQNMVAHLRARCATDAVNQYSLTAVARGPQGYQEDSTTVWTNSRFYNSPDSVFNIYDSCNRIEFAYNANGNTKWKYYKFWIPMPIHLDARDQVLTDSVELGRSHNYAISINTFLTWADQRDITITLLNDTTTNYSDFAVVKGMIHPAARCGRPIGQHPYFASTSSPSNQFIIRFTPTAAGVRTAKFLISNGRGNEDTITVTANSYGPAPVTPHYHVKVNAAGNMGRVYNTGKPVRQPGDTVNVVAVPRRGCIFLGWSDGTRTADYSFVINKDTMLTAYFAVADKVFHFTALQDSADVKFANLNMTSPVGLIFSSDNGNTWSTFDIDSTETIINYGDRLYVRADSVNTRFADILAGGAINGYHFETDSVAVAGDIMYLLNSYNFSRNLPDTAFAGLFSGAEIVNASLLGLPTTAKRACYYGMFQNCTSLTAAPVLPALRLADYCYANMFDGCTSLNTAPLLPAPHLVNHCYSGMFRNCTTLNHINVSFVNWNEADSATFDWVNNVDTVGLFLSASPLPQIVDSTHIPYNWISNPVMFFYHSSNIFRGHVVAVNAATGAPIPSGSIIASGTEVIMTAISNPGYMFVHWASKGCMMNWFMQTDTIRVFQSTSIEGVFHPGHRHHYSPMMADPDANTEIITESTPEAEVVIYTEGTSVIISGIDSPDVSIYDATGRLVTKVDNADYPIEVNIPGIYFVQVNNQPAQRIIIR